MRLRDLFRPRSKPDGRGWHVFGDSHVNAFAHAAEQGLIRRPSRFTSVGGATAVGLRNPNSLTDAMAVFRAALLPARPLEVPVMHLGEVDCGFVIWYRAAKYGESVERQMLESIDASFALVDLLLASGYATAVVTGVTPPTIRDGQDWGDIANKRREVTTSLRERTRLTVLYNARLKEGARRRKLPFIDIVPHVLDRRTGVIGDRYRHPDPCDHHLHPDRGGALWAELLNGVRL